VIYAVYYMRDMDGTSYGTFISNITTVACETPTSAMDTTRDILELLYSAYERFATVQVTGRTWYDVVRVREGWERWAAQQPPGSVAVLEPLEADAAASARPAPAISEWVERLWLHKPSRCRYESGLAGGRRDAIISGDCLDQISSPPESPGAWLAEMLDPAPLIPYL
jgi:hypothetical protein